MTVTIEYGGRSLEGRALIKNELHNGAIILIKGVNRTNYEAYAKAN